MLGVDVAESEDKEFGIVYSVKFRPESPDFEFKFRRSCYSGEDDEFLCRYRNLYFFNFIMRLWKD